MNRALLLALAAAVVPAVARVQGYGVPPQGYGSFGESAEKRAFRRLDDLERTGAFVVSSDGMMLGKISKSRFGDSLGNTFGKGSPQAVDGLFNPFSKYGDRFANGSAFNDFATEPPEIVDRSFGRSRKLGLLMTNSKALTLGVRIDSNVLKAWIESGDYICPSEALKIAAHRLTATSRALATGSSASTATKLSSSSISARRLFGKSGSSTRSYICSTISRNAPRVGISGRHHR